MTGILREKMLSRSIITYTPEKTNMDTKNCHSWKVFKGNSSSKPSFLRSMLVFGSFSTDVPENCWHAGDETPPWWFHLCQVRKSAARVRACRSVVKPSNFGERIQFDEHYLFRWVAIKTSKAKLVEGSWIGKTRLEILYRKMVNMLYSWLFMKKGSVKIQGGPLLAISRGPELRLWGLQPQLPILRPFIGGLFHPIYN